MGNRGLLRASSGSRPAAATRGKLKFGQVFLAAPDVDRDLFLDLARLYPEHAERTTLYASDADLAVHLSSKLHDAPRAGYYKPYTVAPGIDTVAVPDFDVDLLGHGYFAQAEALLHDIYDLMRHNDDPSEAAADHARPLRGHGLLETAEVTLAWPVRSSGRLPQRQECHPHTLEVTGSNPVPPNDLRHINEWFPRAIVTFDRLGARRRARRSCPRIPANSTSRPSWPSAVPCPSRRRGDTPGRGRGSWPWAGRSGLGG